jgi:hypothetical protein
MRETSWKVAVIWIGGEVVYAEENLKNQALELHLTALYASHQQRHQNPKEQMEALGYLRFAKTPYHQ